MSEDRRTHLDLFSGIGGFALAAGWAGFETIAFCEREPFPRRVLRKHWPDVPIIEDVQDLDGRDYRGTALLTGGFPCQPYSHAGKRRGKEDDRHLWGEMARIISEARPRWVLGENVVGLISMGLDEVLSDLEGMDYASEAVVVPACAVDAHHRRDRVWIIGSRNVEDTQGNRGRQAKLRRQESSRSSFSSEDVPDPNGGRFKGGEKFNRQPKQPGKQTCQGRHLMRHCMERPERWIIEPDVGRVAHGIPDRIHRLRGLGNAIVPQVAFEILRLMR